MVSSCLRLSLRLPTRKFITLTSDPEVYHSDLWPGSLPLWPLTRKFITLTSDPEVYHSDPEVYHLDLWPGSLSLGPLTRKFITLTSDPEVYHLDLWPGSLSLWPLTRKLFCFTGKYVEETDWTEITAGNTTFDDYPYSWKNFASAGYHTLFAEDAPQIAIWNFEKPGESASRHHTAAPNIAEHHQT